MSERGEGRDLVYFISVWCVLPARIRWLSQSCALEQFRGLGVCFPALPAAPPGREAQRGCGIAQPVARLECGAWMISLPNPPPQLSGYTSLVCRGCGD